MQGALVQVVVAPATAVFGRCSADAGRLGVVGVGLALHGPGCGLRKLFFQIYTKNCFPETCKQTYTQPAGMGNNLNLQNIFDDFVTGQHCKVDDEKLRHLVLMQNRF